MLRRLTRAAAVATLVAATAAAATAPAPAGAASLERRIASAVSRSGVGASTAVYAWDQDSRQVLYARRATNPVAPASTMKLLTSAAALAHFGPEHRFETRVALSGHQEGRRWIGDVWLIGGGDPSLSTFGFARDNFGGRGANLASLVSPLRQRGIEGVAGRIMVDDDLFDEQRWVAEWKPAFRYEETGALGALTVNESLLGRYVGSTSAHAPDLRAGAVFRSLLSKQGIFVSGGTASGSLADEPEAEVVGTLQSPPLSELLLHMNRASDNFYAETLLKGIGADGPGRTGGASTADGRRAARAVLRGLGIDMGQVTWVDGSGLAYSNRVTARSLGHVLGVGAQADWGPTWIGTFAQSGTSGTLRRRMTRPPYRGRVQAKTGTLNHVSALAGFSTRSANATRRFGFVVVTNTPGRPVPYTASRALQDRIAMILVR